MKQGSNLKKPQTIDDFIFGNPESKLRIEEICDGTQPIPHAGKVGILLYGTYGTGKTTLAKLLPKWIEYAKNECELNCEEDFILCNQSTNGAEISSLINKIMAVYSLNQSSYHYFILDEVDNLTTQAQQSLKSLFNKPRGIFILTSNNITKIDKGLLNRCIVIEMNAAKVHAYLPLAKTLISNTVVNQLDLLSVISAANGSMRDLINNVERLARRQNK